MKKILICFMIIFVCGCSNSNETKEQNNKNVEKQEVVSKTIECNTDDSIFTLVLENGQIVKYIDSIDGDLGSETVDILNEEHLVCISDNDQALSIMNNVMIELGGSCK